METCDKFIYVQYCRIYNRLLIYIKQIKTVFFTHLKFCLMKRKCEHLYHPCVCGGGSGEREDMIDIEVYCMSMSF